MALPLAAVAGRALAGGAGRALGGLRGGLLGGKGKGKSRSQDAQVDFKPFFKALNNLKKQLSPKVNDKQMLEITRVIAGRVLGQAANKTGVTNRRGKFSTSLGSGRAHIKRKYKWPAPATRGKNKGKIPPLNPSVVKSIKYNRKVYTYSGWVTGRIYADRTRNGIRSIVQKGLTKAKNRALKRLVSGKAAWYSIAKANRLPLQSFKDKGQLGVALRAVTGRYKNAIKSKQVNANGRVGIEFKNSVINSVNPHTRGVDAFKKAIKGQSKQVNVLIKKGYITSLSKAFQHLKHTAK